MKISHIIRGEDHLTNTAIQAALCEAFNVEIPLFWHLPIICNTDGKKLSKRDFGFSLNDLRDGGFLPEAINNYLAIIGGSFEEEIMDFNQLIKAMHFDHINASGPIKYDVEKLRWVNHKWIQKIALDELVERSASFLKNESKALAIKDPVRYKKALEILRGEITVLTDIPQVMAFLTTTPSYGKGIIEAAHSSLINTVLKKGIESEDLITWVSTLSNLAKSFNAQPPIIFTAVRIALTGKTRGPALKDIITLLGTAEAKNRLLQYMNFL
jgi:glutamyl/glutaminyl-tRNA synthetase